MSLLSMELLPSRLEDLNDLFTFQADEIAGKMAAFMPKDPTDREAYLTKYAKFLSDPTINMRTIRVDGSIVGSISKYETQGDAEITYWIDRRHWGRGIATKALELFLTMEKIRPIYGRTAFDNIGSQRVLQKCGFVLTGTDKGYANARQADIQEFIFRLD